jgi:L-alanine-DL-glutamate epimerase-like enolase superfamily enzyme
MTALSSCTMTARILSARVSFVLRNFRTPLLLSSGPIHTITEARAEVRVRVDGREAVGRGSIYLSDLWAWPDPRLSHDVRDSAMRALCDAIAAQLPALCGGEAEHPLEMGLRLHDAVMRIRLPRARPPKSGEDGAPAVGIAAEMPDDREAEMPPLARAVCLSPFDAAIHDAVGHALGISAFAFYNEPVAVPTADAYFPEQGAIPAIAAALHPPRRSLAAWLVVGTGEGAEADLAPWIRDRGYHAFKLKLSGTDNAVDAARTISVYRAAKALGVPLPRLCVDSNCANPDADSVQDYLERLRAEAPDAYAALEYVEQPTGRDIAAMRFDWRRVAALKPVLLDEGLTELEQMELAHQQGWSGFAIKTCKGHSFSLVAVAWARQRGMRIAMQDLTNPGLAAIHAFLCAAHLPVINGIELNSPQFTPDANSDWLPRLAPLFEPRNGYHRLPDNTVHGLGSTL